MVDHDAFIQKLPLGRAAIVGDIMLDRYLWCKVRRISPEAPVPIVRIEERSEVLGGAANVAGNMANLKCQVQLFGVCAHDEAGKKLRSLLGNFGIGDRTIADPDRPTITKTRIMAQKQQLLRLDEEKTASWNPEIAEKLLSDIREKLGKTQTLVLSDYGKGLLQIPSFTQKLIELGRSRSLTVLVDPKGSDWERYQGATCITPNIAELESVYGPIGDASDDAVLEAGRKIREKYDLKTLLITRSAQGMCFIDEKGEPDFIPAIVREVFDVSGAGDTAVATFGACLGAGLDFHESARIANLAAGVVVGKVGTQPITFEELDSVIRMEDAEFNEPATPSKVLSLDAASTQTKAWRACGDTIVLISGVFGTLQPEDIQKLHRAKQMGRRLVVGLKVKESEAMLSAQDRASMLSALECVSLLVKIPENEADRLAAALKPDTIVPHPN